MIDIAVEEYNITRIATSDAMYYIDGLLYPELHLPRSTFISVPQTAWARVRW